MVLISGEKKEAVSIDYCSPFIVLSDKNLSQHGNLKKCTHHFLILLTFINQTSQQHAYYNLPPSLRSLQSSHDKASSYMEEDGKFKDNQGILFAVVLSTFKFWTGQTKEELYKWQTKRIQTKPKNKKPPGKQNPQQCQTLA